MNPTLMSFHFVQVSNNYKTKFSAAEALSSYPFLTIVQSYKLNSKTNLLCVLFNVCRVTHKITKSVGGLKLRISRVQCTLDFNHTIYYAKRNIFYFSLNKNHRLMLHHFIRLPLLRALTQTTERYPLSAITKFSP
jgi:hypothetical protein